MNIVFYTVFVTLALDILTCESKNGPQESEVPANLKHYAVPPIIKGNLSTFAGFLDGTRESKMFFWFFPAESDESSSLIVWLQGDIGTSTVKGIFENNGPFYVKPHRGLNKRKHYWSQTNNVLYLDTTVGTGFSYNAKNQYANNIDEVATNLLATLTSFFQHFSEMSQKNLYLAGDGFACQLIAILANRIKESQKFKLKGAVLENPFCDPSSLLNVASHYSNLKIIDNWKLSALFGEEKKILALIQSKEFEAAFDRYDSYIKGLLTPYKTMFHNHTQYKSSRNLLYDIESKFGNYKDYVNKQAMIKYLNVNSTTNLATFSDGKEALKRLRGAIMKGSPKLGELVNNYPVLMYFGQTNPEISPNNAYKMASSINWCGKEYFENLNYSPWFINDYMAGYIKEVKIGRCKGSLAWALIRNAGKDIADEKSEEVLDLLQRFLSDSLSINE